MKLRIVHHEGGLKLYLDREMAKTFCERIAAMAKSGTGDYAEFQTFSLEKSPRFDFKQLMAPDLENFESWTELSEDVFDVNFMVIEKEDFDKMD